MNMSDDENSLHGNGNGTVSIQLEYNMKNAKRGFALIFNHEVFANPNKYNKRAGTNNDCKKLSDTLTAFHFDVEVYKDCVLDEIMHRLNEVSKLDHTNHDCILITILSHGGEGSMIAAHDNEYNLASIFHYFTDEQCPTLKGKPRIFFIQACQGNQLDSGIDLIEGFEHTSNHQIPDFRLNKGFLGCYNFIIPPDFLIACSTISGFRSWRCTINGTWFIQTLCDMLISNGNDQDILTLLTFVNQTVAMDFASNNPDEPLLDHKRQTPCAITTLTRILKFTGKECMDSPKN